MCFGSKEAGPGVDFELKSNGCSADDVIDVASGDDWRSLFGVRSDGLDGATESDAADATGDGDSWDKYWYRPGFQKPINYSYSSWQYFKLLPG